MNKHFHKYLVKKHFFRDFCPQIKNWQNKIAGASSYGTPLTFSEEDERLIRIGLEKMFAKLIK